MSRHAVPDQPHPTYVGWDLPMTTFFVQVYGRGEEADGGPTTWVGTRHYELYDFEQLDPVLRRHHIALPRELRRQLYADRDDGR